MQNLYGSTYLELERCGCKNIFKFLNHTHIEGGELSGTIDELIRHAASKLSHIHFVANDRARCRLIQMGEQEASVFVIGSLDMDVMFSNELPTLETVKKYYEIPYDTYAILMYHPVTTEYDRTALHVNRLVEALLKDTHNYVVIYPNNDMGSHLIWKLTNG